MRLPEIHILCKLAAAAPYPLYAQDMVRWSMGVLKPYSIYAHLATLEEQGLIRRDAEAMPPDSLNVPPRSIFRLTRKGTALFTGDVY